MERLSMRKIRDVLRLKFDCGLSDRQIAKSVGMARSSVADTVKEHRKRSECDDPRVAGGPDVLSEVAR